MTLLIDQNLTSLAPREGEVTSVDTTACWGPAIIGPYNHVANIATAVLRILCRDPGLYASDDPQVLRYVVR